MPGQPSAASGGSAETPGASRRCAVDLFFIVVVVLLFLLSMGLLLLCERL